MGRSDSLPSISSGFVSFAFGYRLSSGFSLLFPGRRTRDRPGRDYRLFPSVFSSGDDRVSQVPGEPTVRMPCSSTPAGPESDAVLPPDGAFRYSEVVSSRGNAISGLNSKAYRLPVYASRPGLLQSAQHAVPAVSTLGRTGLVTRRVPKKVSAFHTFSFSRLGLAHQDSASQHPIFSLIQAKSNYFTEIPEKDQTGPCVADSARGDRFHCPIC